MIKRFTGWHMLAIMVGFFGTVMAVNFTMASYALSTFNGVQVQNSYVASQKFNDWLAAAEAQEELGWEVAMTRRADGRLLVTTNGPGEAAQLTAWARLPLGDEQDRFLAFERIGEASFVSTTSISAERWIVRLELVDGDAQWRREDRL